MTPRILGRSLPLLLTASLAIAACGGAASTSAPTVAPTLTPATQAPAATVPPVASVDPGFSFPIPSGLNADKDLEAILPTEIGGAPVQKFSMTGDTFIGTGQGSEAMQDTLTDLGKTPKDLSVAFAGTPAAVLIAFRVKGVDANTIFAAVVQAQQQDAANITDVTISGKSAKKIVDASGTTTYLYLTGDALVTVAAAGDTLSDALLNEIFSKLP